MFQPGHLRSQRRKHSRRHWYVEEIYGAVQGQWAYLYPGPRR
jgi:transposase-like protein